MKIASDPVVKEKYVLVFNVEKPIHDITYAKKLATEKNMKVVYPFLINCESGRWHGKSKRVAKSSRLIWNGTGSDEQVLS